MIDKQLLEILVCPENHTPLSLADESLLARLNEAIKTGRVNNKGGQAVSEGVAAGLVREDGKVLYPIRDDIPVLLIDEGIALDGID